MARIGINTGSTANDNTGSTLRAAGGIINNNFLELYTYLGAGSTTVLSAPLWSSTNVGINTLRNVGIGTTNPRFTLEVGAVGASGTTLFVNGDARVTGILTIGTASITLNGSTNIINVGTGITINGSTGIISATAIVLGGTTLTGAAVTSITAGSGISVDQSTGNVTITATGGGGGSSQWVTTAAGIHTLSNVGIGTTNPTSALTVQGNISVSGVSTLGVSTFTGTVSFGTSAYFGDNSSLYFGNDNDLRIFYDGSYSRIWETGDFGLDIRTNQFFLSNQAGTESLITATENAGVDLYYDNSKKLETTGTGITVTGTTITNQLSVSGIATASTLNVGTGGTVITTTTAGLVGIGTTNPTSALTVVGASGTTLLVTGGTIPIQIGGNDVSGTIFKVGQINLSGPDVSDVNATYYSNIRYQKVGDFRYDLEFHSGGYTGYGGAAPAGGPGDFIFYKRDIGYGRAERFRISGETGNITSQGGVIAASANVSGISTLGTVKVSSGIVTATSGIVTYYGDTSNAADGRWTLGADGSSNYTFAGIGFTQTTNDPVLYLARGRVYEFVNNSGGSHPFQIRVSNGGAAYSDGVTNNGAASGVIRFEIPFSAPNTLYYQCTNHSGMGNTISVYPNTI